MDEPKPALEPPNEICRCCLTTDRPMKNALPLASYFMDLTGINVTLADGMPQWLCVECCSLLQKAVRFKHKVLRAQTLLYDYIARCAPFPVDAQDEELKSYSSPPLRPSSMLVFETGRGRMGFQKVLEHDKQVQKTELDVMELPAVSKDEDVKEEVSFSDYEDNITLEEYRSNAKLTEDLFTDEEPSFKETKKRKGRKKESKEKKKKSRAENINEQSSSSSSSSSSCGSVGHEQCETGEQENSVQELVLDISVELEHGFDYSNKCLFCGTDASEDYLKKEMKKGLKKRHLVSKVVKPETKDSILKACSDNPTQWSREVQERVEDKDLVSLNTRYHQYCYLRFGENSRQHGKRGRPVTKELLVLMEEIYNFIDNHEDSYFTLSKIKKALPHCSEFDNRTIKAKLMEHYGGKMFVTNDLVQDRIQDKDLVSLNSRYHRNCFIRFRTCPREVGKRGRPFCKEVLNLMEQIYNFIDNHEDSYFTLSKIKESIPLCRIDNRTIKRKLMEHYGGNIFIVEHTGRETLLYFCKNGEQNNMDFPFVGTNLEKADESSD